MRLVKYNTTWFHVVSGTSLPKYVAGAFYPVTDETRAHVGQGIAEEVEVPKDATQAETAAQKAEAAAARAQALAEQARDAADAAVEAKRLADEIAANDATEKQRAEQAKKDAAAAAAKAEADAEARAAAQARLDKAIDAKAEAEAALAAFSGGDSGPLMTAVDEATLEVTAAEVSLAALPAVEA